MSNLAEPFLTPEQQTMQSLRVLSRLLDYPTGELQLAAGELVEIVAAESRWPIPLRQRLMNWCQQIADVEILTLQAEYVALFEQGRATSMLLFEHVHGESRDRGQAMVDLLDEYRRAGFELDTRELPDYLPLFLEYLSTRSDTDMARWIGNIRHILALLTARLEERNSDYALVTYALLALIGAEQDINAHRPVVKAEKPDNTPEALDAVWEEEAVRFSAASDQDCALQSAEGRRLAERKQGVQHEAVRILSSGAQPPAMGR